MALPAQPAPAFAKPGNPRSIARRALVAASLAVLATTARAQSDAPESVVERFHATLLAVMREAARLGARGRFERLRPAMEAAFDLPAMARIAVGPAWTRMTTAQQEAIAAAFAEWSVATYAHRFDGFSGERFATGETSTLRNEDRLVRTTLHRPRGEPVQLDYLLRRMPGGWRIVDVYLTGTISELASRRSEFTALLREGGPERLAAELRQRTATLMRG